MPVYYLDTSALPKRYAQERGTAWIQHITDPVAANERRLLNSAKSANSASKARGVSELSGQGTALPAAWPQHGARHSPHGRGPQLGRRLAPLAATAPALPVREVVALAGTTRRRHCGPARSDPAKGLGVCPGLSIPVTRPSLPCRTGRTSDHFVKVLRIAAISEVFFAVPS